MNFKKILLGSLAVVATAVSLAPANAALNDAEFTSALNWAYENGLTKFNSEDAFMPYANITREQAAKFLASYTVTNLCEVTSSDNEACNFSDINSGDYSLKEYIMLACELGLVRGTGGKFMPTANLTRAEAFTILSRAMSANEGEDAPAEDGTPWYAGHFKAMQDAGVTKETNVEAQTRAISRYELLLVLYRSKMDNAECSDTDVSDLLDELFGDDTTNGTGDDTTDPVVTESNGTAMAKLSSATPNGATLPQGVSVKVASYTFTATDEDVVIQSIDIAKSGLGDDDIVAKLTLFANGDVISKSKSQNSDDVFSFVLSPVVTVKKGESVTIDAVAKIGGSAYSNQEFALSLIDFGTNGNESTTNLPVTANTFRVSGVAGSTVTVQNDGNVSNPNLGDKGVELMKFKLQGDNSNDVEITQVTIVDQKKNADDNLSNLKLLHKGVVVATTAMANGKYVTFTLATPVKIESGKTEKFSVTADVIAGAGDQVSFDIDQAIYVLGNDLKFGYGIAVTDPVSFTEQVLTILAGEVTLSENNLTVDKIRFDRDNVVLASLDLISQAGKSLSLEDIKYMLNGSVPGMNVIFENVELEVTINGSTRTYDLNYAANEYYDTDLGISIPDGATVKINLIADIANQATVTPFLNEEFYFTLSTSSGFEIIELEDDTVVTDVTPSSITFDTVDVLNSTVTVSRLYLGDVDVVRGSKLIDAYKFEVKTDSISSVVLNDITFDGTVTAFCSGASLGDLTKDTVTQFQLHRATNSGWALVDSESASKLAGGALQFTNLNQEIAASTTQQYLVTVDVAGSDSLDGCEFEIARGAVDIEDDDSYTLTVTPDVTPGRTISVQGAGTLSAVVDVIDPKVSSAKHVIGGTTSDWVASFDVTANNEAMDLVDVTVLVSGSANFNANITEVVLYNEAGTELARKGVTSATEVEFTDLANVTLNQGTTTMYVKLITNGIGLNQGTTVVMTDTQLALEIIEARGKSSGTKVSTLPTQYSKVFDVIPAKISNIEFVNSYGGNSVITSFNTVNGYDNANIAILKITTDNWNNLTTAGTTLDVVLDTIQFNIPAGVTSGTIERLGNGTVTPISLVSGLATFPTIDSNSSISKSTTAYYLIKGNIAGGTPNFNVSINGLDAGSFVYETNDAAYGSVTKALIGNSSVNATTIQSSN
jgi:hypothetical protein